MLHGTITSFAALVVLLAGLHIVAIANWNKGSILSFGVSRTRDGAIIASSAVHSLSVESTSNDDTGMHDDSPISKHEVKKDDDDPSQYRILMLHYHKTGFVLSRQLRSHAIQHLTRFTTAMTTNDQNKQQQPMFQMPTKNWGSIQQPRKFNESTKCPGEYHLEGGYINVHESPDFYCSDEELARILLNEEEKELEATTTRIIHFVRNPYSMALSNYYYHAQDPTPEPWVKRKYHPCELKYVDSNSTLEDLLFPTLSDSVIMTKENFNEIARVCRSLYRTTPELENEVFEGHLHQLNPVEGLRLSISQMMIRGGGQMLLPGGDLLRMANTIIKLRALQSTHRFTLVTVSMDDFLSDPAKFTATYLNFLLGNNTQPICPRANCAQKIKRIAKEFEQKYQKMSNKGSSHVTTGRHSSDRDKLKDSLKNDPLFGPILDRIEGLVNEALMDDI